MIEALKQWLLKHKYNYVTQEYGDGGCPTCGYGAEVREVVDYDALMLEIDRFSASFNSK